MASRKGSFVHKPPPKAGQVEVIGKPWAQYGALPYRLSPRTEVLLITSRETGRWVIPKGWAMTSKTRREAAAQEALEEAGVSGKIAREPLGTYDYMKFLKSGQGLPCRVTVFSLEVTQEHERWPEKAQRATRWFSWPEASAAVQEPGLASLIDAFGQSLGRSDDETA
jgi:8-oxo-dGTP pyrophosphatase MutT (NUDIX family)